MNCAKSTEDQTDALLFANALWHNKHQITTFSQGGAKVQLTTSKHRSRADYRFKFKTRRISRFWLKTDLA